MTTIRSVAIGVALLVLAAGCGGGGVGDGDSAADPGDGLVPSTATAVATTAVPSGPPTVLAIVSPATGAEVKGNVVHLDLAASGISIVAADGDTSGRTGHYHVFVDREAVGPGEVIPVATGVIHTTDDPVVIGGMAVGPHRIVVVYGDGTHRRLGLTEAGTSFTVTGPSIDVSTPPNALAGQPVALTVTTEGVTFPEDGFLYVLVDRPEPPAGQPIADEPGVLQTSDLTIGVPDLAPGTHTIRVVAGSADRVPLDPLVMDTVSVAVG